MISLLKPIPWPIPASRLSNRPNSRPNIVDQGLGQTLSSPRLVTVAGPHSSGHRGSLAAHGRQDVVTRRKADKEGERHEPDAEAEVGGDLGE